VFVCPYCFQQLGLTPYLQAAVFGYPEIIRRLLDLGVDVNQRIASRARQ
jgi:hypothetical protein